MQTPKDPDARSKVRTWMYTVNNYTPEDEERLQNIGAVKHHVYGREVAPTTGTPHLQGCITFKTPVRFSKAKKLLGGHLTIPVNPKKARIYCEKDGDFWKTDNLKQGMRSELMAVINAIEGGDTLDNVAKAFPKQYVKYHAGIAKLILAYQPNNPRTIKPTVHWLYGTTGVGKSWAVVNAEADLWITSDSLTYFNGYSNQRAVLFDDFRGSVCKFRQLLRLLDWYAYTAPVKYGHVQFNSPRIYFSSDRHPSDCYDKGVGEIGQLLRRIDTITRIDRTGQSTVQFSPIKSQLKLGPEQTPVAYGHDATRPSTLRNIVEGNEQYVPPVVSGISNMFNLLK